MPRSAASPSRLALALVATTLLVSCSPGDTDESSGRGGQALAGRDGEKGRWDPQPSWVDAYDPQAASSGYNLILMRRRLPVLIDMNGRAVHSWPSVRATGRARLLPDGSLLFIATDGAVREVSWDGDETWSYRLPGEDFPHHDLIALTNGNRLVLAHDTENRIDYLVEVTPGGEVAWTWRALEHLAQFLAGRQEDSERLDRQGNLTHINSVQELGDNSRFARGDQRFRPGNILISARNLNALFIIERPSGRVVWSYEVDLDHQHEALLIADDRPGGGNIIFFNNGLKNLYEYRRSSITEIDPATGAVTWDYRSPTFYSSTGGTQQVLANGNILVTSSRGGRVFELTRNGDIVWQWAPSYSPMRVERYSYDHCPQLAALPLPSEERVRNRNPRRFIDADLYEFALAHETQKTKVSGQSVRALRVATICRALVLPERPELSLGFGTKRRSDVPAERREAVRLAARLRPAEEPEIVLFDGSVELEFGPEGWYESHDFELEGLGLKPAELCLEAADGVPPAFFWIAPTVRSERAAATTDAAAEGDERALQEKHLRALGYVD